LSPRRKLLRIFPSWMYVKTPRWSLAFNVYYSDETVVFSARVRPLQMMYVDLCLFSSRHWTLSVFWFHRRRRHCACLR